MLLTDGGAFCQSGRAWYKLTPNSSGSYVGGTWSTLASMPAGYVPDAYASAVLADGRVVVVGGEYNNGSFALSNMGAIYDPKANTWTMLSPPPSTGSPNHWQCIGDAPATVLADGRFLIGSKLYQDVAVLDPTTLSWSTITATGKTDGFNSEEGWVLLPDGSVFTLDVKNAPASERLLLSSPTTGAWYFAGNTVSDLHTPTTSNPLTAPGCPVYDPPGEIGPNPLMPNGKVFAVGANGLTGVFTPPAAGSTGQGTWAAGPSMPAGLNVEDGPAAVLPSGNVLFGGSPGESGAGLKYFEFNGTSLVSVPAPARAASDATYFTQLLVLPTGQVLFVDGSTTVQLYTPAATPSYNAAWAPTISGVPTSVTAGNTYQINGTQFNGLTQATVFGDESQNATNYPLVRITNNATGHVFYAKTHGHSTMGVATGSAVVFTNFDVPVNIESGASSIQVVANGIPSAAVGITVVGAVQPPSFTLSAADTSLTIRRGSSGSVKVSVVPANGFSGTVAFAASGFPSGVSYSFSPASSSTSSTLSIRVSNSTRTGSYPITITGTSGSLSASTSLTLVVR
jgi:hypothetical protein